MNLLDTAEMYGDGAAERLVGKVIRDYDRESLFLVSKVYPFHADESHIYSSCEQRLRRMATDYMDLYLLHWRGKVPLSETVDCMEELCARGKIRYWGVSNLDLTDMQELERLSCGGHCVTNQVLYHLGSRGVEYELLPWMVHRNMMLMAYCPLAQGGQLRRGLWESPVIQKLAAEHNATPAQILLAFLLTRPGVLPIPCSSSPEHTLENGSALRLRLSPEELRQLEDAFPAPRHRVPLDIV